MVEFDELQELQWKGFNPGIFAVKGKRANHYTVELNVNSMTVPVQ